MFVLEVFQEACEFLCPAGTRLILHSNILSLCFGLSLYIICILSRLFDYLVTDPDLGSSMLSLSLSECDSAHTNTRDIHVINLRHGALP